MKKIFGTFAVMVMALTGAACVHAHGVYYTPSQISINYQSHPGFSFHGHGPKHHGPQFHPPKPHHRPAPKPPVFGFGPGQGKEHEPHGHKPWHGHRW